MKLVKIGTAERFAYIDVEKITFVGLIRWLPNECYSFMLKLDFNSSYILTISNKEDEVIDLYNCVEKFRERLTQSATSMLMNEIYLPQNLTFDIESV